MNFPTSTRDIKRRSVRSRPHWSYSQLNQYMRCPLQYYFERIVKLDRPFVPSGLLFGSAIHEALAEFLHREGFFVIVRTDFDGPPLRIDAPRLSPDMLDNRRAASA